MASKAIQKLIKFLVSLCLTCISLLSISKKFLSTFMIACTRGSAWGKALCIALFRFMAQKCRICGFMRFAWVWHEDIRFSVQQSRCSCIGHFVYSCIFQKWHQRLRVCHYLLSFLLSLTLLKRGGTIAIKCHWTFSSTKILQIWFVIKVSYPVYFQRIIRNVIRYCRLECNLISVSLKHAVSPSSCALEVISERMFSCAWW